jgi:hypothetical protein
MNTSRHVTVVGRLALPRVGARILIHGRLHYDEGHRWHTVDPVEAWLETTED